MRRMINLEQERTLQYSRDEKYKMTVDCDLYCSSALGFHRRSESSFLLPPAEGERRDLWQSFLRDTES